MNFGAQLYTVRAFTQTEQDFAATIQKTAQIGYRFVQISAVGPIPAQALRDICDANDTGIVITHTNPARILNDTEAVIKEHHIMGAGYVGIGSMPGNYRSGGVEGINRFIKDYLPAAQKLQSEGLKLMYHNHDFEFEKWNNQNLLEYLADGFSPNELGFTLDTYWVQAAGGDPACWLRKLAGRVDVIHVKDMRMFEGKQRMCEVLEGNLNWPAIVDACGAAGVKWAMVEQDDCYGQDPFECLRISFKNMKEAF